MGRDAVPSHTILSRQYDNCSNNLVLSAEYFLFMKDMKMDKQEVKREYKEQEGNPEIKSKLQRTPSRNSVRAIEI